MYARSQIRTRQAQVSPALALVAAQDLKSQTYQHRVRLTTVIARNQFAIHLCAGTGPLGTLREFFRGIEVPPPQIHPCLTISRGAQKHFLIQVVFRTYARTFQSCAYLFSHFNSLGQAMYKNLPRSLFTFPTSLSNKLWPWMERIKKTLVLLDVAHLHSSGRGSPSPVAWLESSRFNADVSNY